jgi:hypothetical protein
MTHEMQELADGVAFWQSRRWPADFHNSQYATWAKQDPSGDFTINWWHQFLPILRAWKATRPSSDADLTSRFTQSAAALSSAWQVACLPWLEEDVSTVAWDQVKAFPIEVAKIKPTKAPSPVFTSKFCHFLLPRVFPVVDNEGLGNRWPTYAAYFGVVQDEWGSTSPATRADLSRELTRLIEASGKPVFSGFPMTNKIVELLLMGRHHPGSSATRNPLAPELTGRPLAVCGDHQVSVVGHRADDLTTGASWNLDGA